MRIRWVDFHPMPKRFLTPFQKFVKIESLSGVLLFGATLIALVWANSPLAGSYEDLWGTKLAIGTDRLGLDKPLILWVNDGLMAIFFFLIGLEIKREITIGELNSLRKATFPIFAALGGMFAPLGVFLLFNQNPDTADGWGIPMATDIAFTLAIVQALGSRVPLQLKIFLTAFAIVDDLGAVLIIAIFYSGGIVWSKLLIGLALVAFLGLLSYRQYYSKYLTIPIAVAVWYLFLKAGIHPTIAGVLVAFTIPIRQKIDIDEFRRSLNEADNELDRLPATPGVGLSKEQINKLDDIQELIEEAQSPLQRLEHQLHGWVAYLIIPIFALANAGISLSTGGSLELNLVLAIAAALFVGKLIGIPLLSFLAVKLGIAELPEGVSAGQVIGIAILAGVGFTMSIFIANLAYADSVEYIGSAKVGILAGSLLAAVVGAGTLWFAGRARTQVEGA